jgi:hypothetical protein
VPALLRLTQSGACASCGAYGNSRHETSCQPEVKRRFRLEPSQVAQHDDHICATLRDRARFAPAQLRWE